MHNLLIISKVNDFPMNSSLKFSDPEVRFKTISRSTQNPQPGTSNSIQNIDY